MAIPYLWAFPILGGLFDAATFFGGVHLLQLLNFWQQQLWQLLRFHPGTLHFMAETMKIAYADRLYIWEIPSLSQFLLLPQRVAQQRVTGLDLKQARPAANVIATDSKILQQFRPESLDASHLMVVDGDRNAVSLTFTVNLSFAAGVVAAGTGIVLNNEMDDFSAAPASLIRLG